MHCCPSMMACVDTVGTVSSWVGCFAVLAQERTEDSTICFVPGGVGPGGLCNVVRKKTLDL